MHHPKMILPTTRITGNTDVVQKSENIRKREKKTLKGSLRCVK